MIAFYLPGHVPVYAFSVLLGLGATLGLVWVALQAPGKETLSQVNAGLWFLFGAAAGGRALYVAINWAYFAAHPGEALLVSLGGLSWPGAVVGGIAALLGYAAFTRRAAGLLADALLPLAAMLTVCTWLACWADGCAYGQPAQGWWALPSRDEWGEVVSRVPVQLMGALLSVGLFWLVDRARLRLGHPGAAASLALVGFSLLMLFLSSLRADPAPMWNSLRVDGWAALALACLATLAFFLTFKPTSQP